MNQKPTKSDRLFDALGGIDDSLLVEAMEKNSPSSLKDRHAKAVVLRIAQYVAAIAACLVIFDAVISIFPQLVKPFSAANELKSTETTAENGYYPEHAPEEAPNEAPTGNAPAVSSPAVAFSERPTADSEPSHLENSSRPSYSDAEAEAVPTESMPREESTEADPHSHGDRPSDSQAATPPSETSATIGIPIED